MYEKKLFRKTGKYEENWIEKKGNSYCRSFKENREYLDSIKQEAYGDTLAKTLMRIHNILAVHNQEEWYQFYNQVEKRVQQIEKDISCLNTTEDAYNTEEKYSYIYSCKQGIVHGAQVFLKVLQQNVLQGRTTRNNILYAKKEITKVESVYVQKEKVSTETDKSSLEKNGLFLKDVFK